MNNGTNWNCHNQSHRANDAERVGTVVLTSTICLQNKTEYSLFHIRITENGVQTAKYKCFLNGGVYYHHVSDKRILTYMKE